MINENWEAEFKERLQVHFDEMKWLYYELYHTDHHAFEYFLEMLHTFYVERSDTLKKWDEVRAASPDWFKGNETLGEVMYVDCFADNLKGVQAHLDYLEESGINYLHLMPLLCSPKGRSDGGYAVSDFRNVEPDLGTIDDLMELSNECHLRGINVCLDFVMNHTSEDHEWARKAREGDISCQERYFFFDNWEIPNQFEKTVPQVFPTTAPGNFTWCEQAHKVVMTTFYPYQWDLNYANPTVFNDMTANLLYLCNHGIDIVRLDAVPYIWKSLGTNCRNLPQVHTLVRLMRMAAEVVCPGTMLLGEVVMEPSKVVPYFGTLEKPECHLLYNVTTMASTWHTVATHDVRLLKHQLGQVFAMPKEYTFLNYLRCHDDIGWGLDYDFLKAFGSDQVPHKKYLNDYLTGKWQGSDSRGELYNDDPTLGDARLCGTTASLCGIEAAEYEQNLEKLDRTIRFDIMLHAFLFTQSGIPVIYSGDEIGQLNDYSYHENPLKWDDSRYLHRGKLNWDEVALRNDTKSRQGRLYQALRKLEEIRKEHIVFEAMADTWIVETYNDRVLGIGRYFDGEKLIALFNFSEYDETAWVNEVEDYVDLMTGNPRAAKAVGIPAYDFAWLLTSFGGERKHRKQPTPRLSAEPVETKTKEAAETEAEVKVEAVEEAAEAKAEAVEEAVAEAEVKEEAAEEAVVEAETKAETVEEAATAAEVEAVEEAAVEAKAEAVEEAAAEAEAKAEAVEEAAAEVKAEAEAVEAGGEKAAEAAPKKPAVKKKAAPKKAAPKAGTTEKKKTVSKAKTSVRKTKKAEE